MKQPTEKQKIGKLGEDIAERFLMSKGHVIVARNYRKSYGEIDIVSQKSGITHFVEVKTVSRETREIENNDNWSPLDNVHPWKLRRLWNTISVYMEEHGVEGDLEFSVIAVFLDKSTKKANVKMYSDLPLG